MMLRENDWPAAVLFDFDGVIVNSEPIHFAAFRKVAAEVQIELTEGEYYDQLIGFDDRGGFIHLFHRHGKLLDDFTLKQLMDRKARIVREVLEAGAYRPLPGADQLIRSLAKRLPLAICSGALRSEIESMLLGIGLRECFQVIVSAEDVNVGKPDPQGYLLTLQKLAELSGHKLRPADCLIVEDAPNVIASVKAAGFPVLAVATSYPIESLSSATFAVRSLETAEIDRVIPELIPHE